MSSVRIEIGKDRSATFSVHGSFSVEVADKLQSYTERLLRQNVSKLNFDLARTGYMDSIGVASLLEVKKRMVEQGGSIAVLNVSDSIQKFLRMIRVWEQLEKDVVTD